MLAGWNGQRRVAKMEKSLANMKVVILCAIVIFIVIFSVLTDNNFSTLQSDLLGRCQRENNLVEEVNGNETANKSINPNSYESFDISKIMVDEELEEKKEPEKPYSLGPKVTDWDKQREIWLEKNPQFPSFVQSKKPRVLLVTGSSPKPCDNPVGDHYLLKSIKNKMDYCRIHGMEIFYNMALLDAEMSGFWAKIPLLRKLMLSHPEVEFFWWMDSDAMFTDMAFELPWERYKDSNLVIHGWNETALYVDKFWVAINTGSSLIRNTQWSLDLLDALAPFGPKGPIRDQAGELLSKELTGRPVFEADDQSALVYLLTTQREKWGNKVYLEKAYHLHGYWEKFVDKYEELIEKYHPGFGDDRWPFVTHFTGCKPCAKAGNYPAERCIRQMERAFNFGDNQVLGMYGFGHKSLETRRVVRTHHVEDEFGLLHPSYKGVIVSST